MYRKIAYFLLIAFDNINGTRIHSCREYLEKSQWMKKKDIQRLQLKRLKALLSYAYEYVQYYRESFKRERFHPSMVKSLDDIRKIPVLSRSEVRSHLDTLISSNFHGKQLIPFLTSGTTASPLRFFRSKSDLSWTSAAEFRAYSWAGYEFGDKRALIWAFEPKEIRSIKFRFQNVLRRDKILDVTHLTSEDVLSSYALRMHRFGPDFIRGYSLSLNLFATFVMQNSHLSIRPKSISTSASMLLPHYRKTIEKAFKCKVFDFYGSREISSIAAQCGHHEGLHVTEENVILEIVRNGERASSGEEGKILLTNLHSYAMPLIRYDIGDLGKAFADTCSCGRELSLVKPIGRTYEYFINTDGSFTFLRDFQTVFEDLPIREFQVVQENPNDIIIRVVSLPEYTSAHTDFIIKNIKVRGKANIRVELVDSIQTEKNRKIKYVVSKIPSKYT